jgi:uncharacterized protein YlxW (UPF0749 family)
MEELNSEKPESMQAWNEVTQKVLELQSQWKKIGFAPQKMNTKIFERFRAACDEFFTAKTEYFKEIRGKYADNLAKKEALCEKAEALKDSTDWKATADALTKLKEEWKAIGPVARKQSDVVWKRFISACDTFFDNRKKVHGGVHSEERENLKKKRAILEQLQQLVEEKAEDIQAKVKELQEEWNAIGHVPFKEKDALYETYHSLTDKIYGALNMNRKNRRMNNFKNSVKNAVEAGGNALVGERNRLQKAYEKLAAEVKTYENNLNFLTSNSKKGNSLVDQMVKKMEKQKEELALLRQKIQTVDEEIRKENED